MDDSALMMHRLEDPSPLIAQDDTAAPLRFHTPTHLETVPPSAAFKPSDKKGNMQQSFYNSEVRKLLFVDRFLFPRITLLFHTFSQVNSMSFRQTGVVFHFIYYTGQPPVGFYHLW